MAKRNKRARTTPGKKAAQAAGASSLRPAFHAEVYWGTALVLATVVTYAQLWHAGFVWDDDSHVVENPCIVGPLGLKEIWTTQAGMPFPLVFTTFWIEHALWGLDPLPYHLVNILMQAACAILLWRVLLRLQVPGAWLGAALWALNPVQVESVAWVAEMKNTQSGLFYLASILFFLKSREAKEAPSRRDWNYTASLVCGALAMASKSTTVVLPVVLGLCLWWMKDRFNRASILRLAPFLGFSLISIAVTVWPRTAPDMLPDPHWAQTWPQRIAISGDAFWFYLGKLVWPHPLMAVYPRWETDAANPLSYVPVVALVALMTGLWIYRETKLRPVFFAFAYFLVVIGPFLGLINQAFWRFSFVEDHLQYLACMGPLALAGFGLTRVGELLPIGPRLRVAIPGGVALLTVAIVSWLRCGVWADDEMLWRDNVAKNSQCWVGYNNLGNDLALKGQNAEAIPLFQKALELYPGYSKAHNGLGLADMNSGRLDDAMAEYDKALEIEPSFAVAQNGLGVALLQKRQLDDAIRHFQKALELRPTYDEARSNLAGALCQEGRYDEGIAQFQALLARNPNAITAHANLGNAYLRKGEVNQAMAEIEAALRIDPDYAPARQLLARAQALAQQAAAGK